MYLLEASTLAFGTCSARQRRLNGDSIANFEVASIFADLTDDTTGLVAEDQGGFDNVRADASFRVIREVRAAAENRIRERFHTFV